MILMDGFPYNPEQLPPLVLAYIGDAVYELAIRQYLAGRGLTRVNQLHRETIKYVRADNQARVLRALEDKLLPEEAALARRGRNAKSGHPPHGADVSAYRHSTGLECLIGYLYLAGRHHRLAEIMALARQAVEERQ
ncbi:Mini-ribonuclease 3 [Desulfotomaculum copahuensis]|uniref:Mini-ribonuclease 3 n=1 Tax=Desulfotomaculum copahuensis TaxID=1838280 RepID=A0A1B7LGP5_9FIRM|nr:ribonuclease III domain-containing protein [Desulfotomaculum copahuensis]OAT85240.1 ribonuclease III [Desulfotomaculum copahuensis]